MLLVRVSCPLSSRYYMVILMAFLPRYQVRRSCHVLFGRLILQRNIYVGMKRGSRQSTSYLLVAVRRRVDSCPLSTCNGTYSDRWQELPLTVCASICSSHCNMSSRTIPFAGWATAATLALIRCSRLWVCCDHMLTLSAHDSSSPTRDQEQRTP